VALSLPIALGVNYTDKRVQKECTFYNSDFIIYSSMGSFYIPTVIMLFLYWRIFAAIRLRAKQARDLCFGQ
jgi:dopamine receptor D2